MLSRGSHFKIDFLDSIFLLLICCSALLPPVSSDKSVKFASIVRRYTNRVWERRLRRSIIKYKRSDCFPIGTSTAWYGHIGGRIYRELVIFRDSPTNSPVYFRFRPRGRALFIFRFPPRYIPFCACGLIHFRFRARGSPDHFISSHEAVLFISFSSVLTSRHF